MRRLECRAADRFGVTARLPLWREVRLPQTTQALLCALVIVADWVASNEEYFPYEPDTLGRSSRVDQAWQALDLPTPWRAVASPSSMAELFESRFGFGQGVVVRPVQAEAVAMAQKMPTAGVLLVEAPMSEGKTEAAFSVSAGSGGLLVELRGFEPLTPSLGFNQNRDGAPYANIGQADQPGARPAATGFLGRLLVASATKPPATRL